MTANFFETYTFYCILGIHLGICKNFDEGKVQDSALLHADVGSPELFSIFKYTRPEILLKSE